MAPLTVNRDTDYSQNDLLSIAVEGGVRIFTGSIVCLNPAGYAVPGSDIVGYVFAGIATAEADNRLGGDGDIQVVVRRRGRFRFASQSHLIQAAVGACVYVVDDQTIEADAAQVTNDVMMGVLARILGALDCLIDIFFECRLYTAPTTTTAAPTTSTTTAAP